MKSRSLRVTKISTKWGKNKTGFTLLETMLAVAILLIVSMVVYLGFLSTLKVSAYTAMYERAGKDAASDANDTLSGSQLGTSNGNIILSRTDIPSETTLSLGIINYTFSPDIPNPFSDNNFSDTDNPASTHRQVFKYVS